MKINKIFRDHLNGHIPGRIRLKLFELITGDADEQPTKEQGVTFVTDLGKKDYDFAELILHLLAKSNYTPMKPAPISGRFDTEAVFTYLNENPLTTPVLFVAEDGIDGLPTCIWVRCNELKDGSGYFYTLILFDEEGFPNSIFEYLEFRVADTKPEYAVTNKLGDLLMIHRSELADTEHRIVQFCLRVLQQMTAQPSQSFLTMNEAMRRADSIKGDRYLPPEDPRLFELIKAVSLGDAVCSVAQVELAQVIPFSYDHCFELPLQKISQAEDMADALNKRGMLVYWNGSHFVMGDDYTGYLALRKASYQKVKCVIMGEVPGSVVVEETGGLWLLPPLLTLRTLSYESLPLALKDAALQEYLNQLNAGERVKSIAAARCVFFTEDRDTQMLKTLLISCGFDIDGTVVYSYENCTRLDGLQLNIQSIRTMNPEAAILVHRDRDYLTDDAIARIESRIQAAGATAFVTKGNCMESYFLDAVHIRAIYPELSVTFIDEIIREVIAYAKPDAIDRLIKAQGINKDAAILLYDEDPFLYAHGKIALGKLVSILQTRLKRNPKLVQRSFALHDERLRELGVQLWVE
ncbi:hypothetical protein GWC95_15660 [Sediminibacterium roseum]|uniref:Uncharacterized protein n=1 Tax=Sediminibacterium roseum TaxID=1978412 RepID=A0ABX0A2D2_9BACT|nr:hypothetical protein [Sediminibacterium roseum]NCI51365.1 hypothetical protein [Sediminibacterium roseum]